jgi:hypothetical protein
LPALKRVAGIRFVNVVPPSVVMSIFTSLTMLRVVHDTAAVAPPSS